MNCYRIFCIVGLVGSTISTCYIVATHAQRRGQVEIGVGIDFVSPNELLICGITSYVLEAYFFICINSLFLNIKEGRPRHEKLTQDDGIHQPSVPLFNEASEACFEKVDTSMQPESPNGTTQSN